MHTGSKIWRRWQWDEMKLSSWRIWRRMLLPLRYISRRRRWLVEGWTWCCSYPFYFLNLIQICWIWGRKVFKYQNPIYYIIILRDLYIKVCDFYFGSSLIYFFFDLYVVTQHLRNCVFFNLDAFIIYKIYTMTTV